MDAPFLEAFKARLYGALGNVICWVAALPTAEGWNQVSFKAISNSSHSMIVTHPKNWQWKHEYVSGFYEYLESGFFFKVHMHLSKLRKNILLNYISRVSEHWQQATTKMQKHISVTLCYC